MQKNIKKLIITEDGSHTLFVPSLNEHYHSTYGAVNESMHVFITNGFRNIIQNHEKINILEVGFGTGLNALLTLSEATKNKIQVHYSAYELYPLPYEIYSQLNYAEFLKNNSLSDFIKLHKAAPSIDVQISEHFTLHKIIENISELKTEKEKYHLVYFDAFAPDIQPELWTKNIFDQIINAMFSGGILTTYCAKGSVKRVLKEVGFVITNPPGPKGKREMTVAVKGQSTL